MTPEEFQSKFGFRGGEFGKWVKQGKGDKERQAILNSAYDALMDWPASPAFRPGPSPERHAGHRLRFAGKRLGIGALRARQLVMNLTKTRGAGALAHGGSTPWTTSLQPHAPGWRRTATSPAQSSTTTRTSSPTGPSR